MKVERKLWSKIKGWSFPLGKVSPLKASLVLYFGKREVLEKVKIYETLKDHYPNAHIMGCSSGGEIFGAEVHDGCITSMAIELEHTPIEVYATDMKNDSFEVGVEIAQKLLKPDLKGIFTLSDGITMNGSDFVRGISSIVGKNIPITGGLAGDGDQFKETIVGCDSAPQSKKVAAVGFYGDRCHIGFGSIGGWSTFGPQRLVTRSEGNILYELDNKPALDLYKRYLGEMASQLPSSALLYPLAIRPEDEIGLTVRTILSVNEDNQSMIFAGDIPQGHVAYLMKGNRDDLVDGAADAAHSALIPERDQLAILVSCIGRKLLMGQRIGDEVEAVQGVMGASTPQIGFYSYGELSPHEETGICELHNQTMTITTLTEV